MLAGLRKDVPPAAFILGLAGAVPFVGLALLALAGGVVGARAVAALLAYAAIILGFLGGVHWGWAMAAGVPHFARLAPSVVPALVGWGGVLLAVIVDRQAIGLLVIALGFAGLLWLDLAVVAKGQAAAWYRRLRWPLTLIVVASLILASLAAGV